MSITRMFDGTSLTVLYDQAQHMIETEKWPCIASVRKLECFRSYQSILVQEM